MKPGPESSVEELARLAEIQQDVFVSSMLGVGGLLWMLAYVIIIYRGFKDRSCGMPLIALAVNFAWEVMWGFIHPDKPPMDTINRIWAGIDVLIVIQFLVYGRRTWPEFLPKWSFYPMVAGVLGLGFGFVYLGTYEFADWEVGGAYVAYLDNLMMSALFVHWAVSRSDVDGQSMWVAITKCLGTLAISFGQFEINDFVIGGSPFLTFLFGACLLLDVLYIVLLFRRMRALGIANPLRRL